MMNKNYLKFKELFKKGEQIFVGFNHGETSGFIKTINKNGFGLIQLKNSREIIYPWDQFNLICTPGFRINKVGSYAESMLWELLSRNKKTKWTAIYPYVRKDPPSRSLEYFLSQEGLCGVTPHEITSLDKKFLKFKIGTEDGWIGFEDGDNLICKKNKEIHNLTKLIPATLSIFKKNKYDCSAWGDAIPDAVEAVRNKTFKWEGKVYCGDPWSIEDITHFSDGVFSSKQGILMPKIGSDIWI